MRTLFGIAVLLLSSTLAAQVRVVPATGQTSISPSQRPESSQRPGSVIDSGLLQGLGEIRYHRLDSQVVERGFHIFVRLPEGYTEGSRDYPTLYLLDGGITFPLLSGYYRYLVLGEEIPEAILVGISYGTDDWQQGNLRSTDFTAPSEERQHWGGASRFQEVFRTELFPLIETTYRSDGSRRVVFGQSLGGQFVLFTAQTLPTLFWGHIASNPALHRNLALFLEMRPRRPAAGQSRLFVASGSNDEPRFRTPALAWMEHWSRQHDLPWALEATTLEGHSHFSAAPAAFRQGLTWIFSDDEAAAGSVAEPGHGGG